MNPAHLDYDVLADLAEGLLEDDRAASVSAHLDACAECRDRSADLADVSRILAEAPVPPMPAELAQRIDTAIAAESLNNATVVSLEQRRGRRQWRILSAAAAAVIVLGGGGTIAKVTLDGANGHRELPASAPAQDRPAAPSFAAKSAYTVISSGTDYRAGTLPAQVGEGLKGTLPSKTRPAPPDARLAGCVTTVTGGRQPELVDQARYEGRDATVIAVRGDTADRVTVWIVGPDCTASDPHLISRLTL
ncbi:anti-sigma factor family protein [Spirillospora albida]|uniref:anti-sigma factor family protein n=1 Tax=Spirillospora albida TaxID=58123 RepID=UPI0004C1C427|nr:hypothetical protein [Spirillospora albida]